MAWKFPPPRRRKLQVLVLVGFLLLMTFVFLYQETGNIPQDEHSWNPSSKKNSGPYYWKRQRRRWGVHHPENPSPNNTTTTTTTHNNNPASTVIHSTAGGTTDSTSRSSPRISFTLHRNRTYRNQFNTRMNCNTPSSTMSSGSPPRAPLSPTMAKKPDVLDFTTFWETDLKILVMGDSVAIQLSQTLEEVVQAQRQHRQVLRMSWEHHEGLHVSAPVQGGGVVAGWRLLHFLLAQNRGGPLPNHCCGGWRMTDVERLLRQPYTINTTTDQQQNTTTSTATTAVAAKQHVIGSFDVLIFRISHGWHDLDAITKSNLYETIQMAHSLFGVKTVIFLSLPFCNNVQTLADLERLKSKRRLLKIVARRWNTMQQIKAQQQEKQQQMHDEKQQQQPGPTVLVLEMDQLTDQLIEWNAKLLGMNTTTPKYLLEPVEPANRPRRSGRGYTPHTAHVCAERQTPTRKMTTINHQHHDPSHNKPSSPSSCTLNSITRDGMHWCFETIGGRLFAGLACQLICVYPPPQNSSSSSSNRRETPDAVEECAQACNEKYMTLQPIPSNEIL